MAPARCKLFGQEVPVRAQIHTINGFSGHGDQATLLKWHEGAGTSALTFLVHGEPKSAEALGHELERKGGKTRIPALHQGYEL